MFKSHSVCGSTALFAALALPTVAQDEGQSAELFVKAVHKAQWRYVLPDEQLPPAKIAVGTIHGTTVTVMDIDGDGKWNQIGKDMMVIGRDTAATYVSKVASLGGKLYTLEVAEDGKSVTTSPFTGPTGTLDLKSEFRCFGTLDALVLHDEKQQSWFNLAGHKAETLPAGKYTITFGLARKDKELARIGQGKMPPIVVTNGGNHVVKWGSTVTAEFDYVLDKGEVTVQPDLRFFGRGGEEYLNFQPNLKSPKFLVYDAKTKKLVASGRFGGC